MRCHFRGENTSLLVTKYASTTKIPVKKTKKPAKVVSVQSKIKRQGPSDGSTANLAAQNSHVKAPKAYGIPCVFCFVFCFVFCALAYQFSSLGLTFCFPIMPTISITPICWCLSGQCLCSWLCGLHRTFCSTTMTLWLTESVSIIYNP